MWQSDSVLASLELRLELMLFPCVGGRGTAALGNPDRAEVPSALSATWMPCMCPRELAAQAEVVGETEAQRKCGEVTPLGH